MAFQYPLAEPLFIILERQIPVSGLLFYGFRTAELALRVDELFRAEGGAAVFALVAVGPLMPALGAGPDNIAVSEEGPCFGIVELFALPGDEFALVVQFEEKIRGEFFV